MRIRLEKTKAVAQPITQRLNKLSNPKSKHQGFSNNSQQHCCCCPLCELPTTRNILKCRFKSTTPRLFEYTETTTEQLLVTVAKSVSIDFSSHESVERRYSIRCKKISSQPSPSTIHPRISSNYRCPSKKTLCPNCKENPKPIRPLLLTKFHFYASIPIGLIRVGKSLNCQTFGTASRQY